MISDGDEGTQIVGFALDAQTATLTAYLAHDDTHESDSDVTAAIQTKSDYTVGTPSSATVTVTDDDHVPGPPTGLTATLTHRNFDLSWTAPSDEGASEVIYYHIDIPGVDTRNFYVGTTVSNVLASEYNPGDYTVRIRARNQQGAGDWSAPIVVAVRLATITIGGTDPVTEGSDAVFTLTVVVGLPLLLACTSASLCSRVRSTGASRPRCAWRSARRAARSRGCR